MSPESSKGGSGGSAASGAVACQISRTTTWIDPATGIASRTHTKPPKRPPTQLPMSGR